MLIQIHEVPRDKTKEDVKRRFLELMGAQSELAGGESIWPLPNLRETTIGNFFWAQSSMSWKATAHILQFKHEPVDLQDPSNKHFGHPRWSHAFVYLSDKGSDIGGGYVILWTYNRMDYNSRDPGAYADALGSKSADAPCIQVYTWEQCAHDWKETGPDDRRNRGWHEYTCSKCGAHHDVDSGD